MHEDRQMEAIEVCQYRIVSVEELILVFRSYSNTVGKVASALGSINFCDKILSNESDKEFLLRMQCIGVKSWRQNPGSSDFCSFLVIGRICISPLSTDK